MPFLHMVGHHHRVRNFVNQLIFPIYGWALINSFISEQIFTHIYSPVFTPEGIKDREDTPRIV